MRTGLVVVHGRGAGRGAGAAPRERSLSFVVCHFRETRPVPRRRGGPAGAAAGLGSSPKAAVTRASATRERRTVAI